MMSLNAQPLTEQTWTNRGDHREQGKTSNRDPELASRYQ